MTLSGTRGLVRVSKNPDCHVQAAMALERVREPEFYERVAGDRYPGEYGERLSARRRGTKFEANLSDNNAAGLREALGPTFGWDADVMVVRNFAEEVPGPPTTMRAARLVRTRRVLNDLAEEREPPHLLIQPQLALPTGAQPAQFEYVSPDFMVLDPVAQMYVPGEEKSFILRHNVAEPGDLDLTRRQAAAQILGLRAEADLLGLRHRVDTRAVFVMATPWGLRAAPPVIETLDAAVREIERAIETLGVVRAELTALRAQAPGGLEELVAELPINFQEECHRTCILAAICQERSAGEASLLGDAAADLLGSTTQLARVEALIAGEEPRTEEERKLVSHLRVAGEALGIGPDELGRRLA